MGEFEVTYTFGWFHLRQYLVPFPGGRLQCLPIPWDVKERRWYQLYPQEPVNPKGRLYWTHRDVRCSDCQDVHGLMVIKERKALCLQCHRAPE